MRDETISKREITRLEGGSLGANENRGQVGGGEQLGLMAGNWTRVDNRKPPCVGQRASNA